MGWLSIRLVGLVGVLLLEAAGPASAGGLPSTIERCLGLRPNQDLPSVIERRYGLRPNRPLPSAVEQDILRRCRYGSRHNPYSRDRYERYDRYDRYDRDDRYGEWDHRPRYRPIL